MMEMFIQLHECKFESDKYSCGSRYSTHAQAVLDQ